jgi:hypothetical protein
LKKKGYKDFTGTIKKEKTEIAPIIGGIFLLFPFIWTLGYPEEYNLRMEVQKETSSLSAVPGDKGTSPPTGSPSASGSLKIQIQPSEKKVIEANLKRPGLDEDYLIAKIFYFDNCAFGYDKFNHFIRFQRGGRLEGAWRSRGGPAAVSKSSIDFSSLNRKWVIDKNQIIIDFQMLKGFPQRRVMKVEVDIGPDRKDVFPAKCESSTGFPARFYIQNPGKQACLLLLAILRAGRNQKCHPKAPLRPFHVFGGNDA